MNEIGFFRKMILYLRYYRPSISGMPIIAKHWKSFTAEELKIVCGFYGIKIGEKNDESTSQKN